MPPPQLGNIELLNIRELWKHEERDFTPWLAKNIEQLSALLGVQIVVDHTEHKVGGYELDPRDSLPTGGKPKRVWSSA